MNNKYEFTGAEKNGLKQIRAYNALLLECGTKVTFGDDQEVLPVQIIEAVVRDAKAV